MEQGDIFSLLTQGGTVAILLWIGSKLDKKLDRFIDFTIDIALRTLPPQAAQELAEKYKRPEKE